MKKIYVEFFEFDGNNLERIFRLLLLQEKCLTYHEEMLAKFASEIGARETTNFYMHIYDITSVPLVFLLNDEITASLKDRGTLPQLIDKIKEKIIDGEPLRRSLHGLEDIFRWQADHLIGSSFLDFIVNVYSAFEQWLSKVYEFIAEKDIVSERRRRLEALVLDYCAIQKDDDRESVNKKKELLTKMMERCQPNIQGSNKIDLVIKKIKGIEYCRDIEADARLISFFRTKRNTVHNGGYNYHGREKKFEIEGEILYIKSDSACYDTNWCATIRLCFELVEIYHSMIKALEKSCFVELDMCFL